MTLRKPMTETEKRLFREAVIREYQLKHQKNLDSRFNIFFKRLKKIAPLNLLIGILACAILVLMEGWKTLFHVLLYIIIWTTLASVILSVFVKAK